ncbi:hypothetical protein [Caldivirga maquilingensis]|uniref:Uncharacterized protein n=1 Tax=Caldivirga maquilingensis (strain ATCC 700844 / DSM 13496 / JCM 10307 / IC-167) TaxID=397948 RepID=A8M8Y0_CALMQ|nr:hypothetical protein [Caldivirga maquilingensis]ABW02199.1 conserved hypothetical protein [Caldivirga maquilingensis IC-167]
MSKLTVLAVALAVILITVTLTILLMHHSVSSIGEAKLILWIVPWGAGNYTVPPWAVPGVVLAYQCNDPQALMPWINWALYTIQQYVNEDRPVFINIFCEIYQPSYKWRGTLDYINVPQFILQDLKKINPSGKGFYIGFSEEAACVANATCRGSMIKIYNELRVEFPEAGLFYYASGGENANDVLALAKGANLTLVGYDIWDYRYVNGVVTVPEYLISNLKTLKSSGFNVMVGEVGFRYCDEKAYVDPANWNVKFTWNCTAPAVYMSQVLGELTSSINPVFIGIWAWNDNTFGVVLNPNLISALENYTKG